jgi:hypothetical protein
MTLIISYLTPDFILQVSDRRLTVSDGKVDNDAANKGIVYCGRMALAYTGRSKVGAENTDEWVTKILQSATTLPEVVEIIRDRASAHFNAFAVAPQERRLAFVGAGWALNADGPTRRVFCRISNFHNGLKELPRGSTDFSAVHQIIESGEPAQMVVTGRQLTEDEFRLLWLALKNNQDPSDAVLGIIHAIRIVARRDSAVGKNIVAVYLPRNAVETGGLGLVSFGWPFSPDGRGSAYFPEDANEVVEYAPNLVCPGVAFTGVKSGPRRPTP